MKALKLRTYQREALDALIERFREDAAQRLAVVLPTGGGKTVCFAHQALEHLEAHPADRVVVLVHTDELVSQAYQKIKDVAPGLNVGIVKAARRDVVADVIVASVHTLRNPLVRDRVKRVSLVIVDECHHALAKSYVDILTAFGCFDGRCRAVGYTATLMRGDGKSLFPVWQDVAFQRDISWMVRKRHLKPPHGTAIHVPDLDLRSVKSTRSDYREGELGEALAESLAPELVVKGWLEHAEDRKTLGFFPTVASAIVFQEAFRAAGIGAEVIYGAMPLEDRRRVLAEHRAGKFPVLVNCMILTEGYDDPEVSCIIVGRPTKSRGLYIQMAGRGLRVDPARPYEDQDCLLLDVVGASAIHDLRSIADLSERPLKPEEARDGRTLIDLEDEFDAGPGVEMDEPQWYTGDVVVSEFDPLGAPSTKVWLKTRGGTFFVPAGKGGYVFIAQYPTPGQWSVCWAGTSPAIRFTEDHEGIPRQDPKGRPVGMTVHRGLPLEQALTWAEDLAVDMGAATLNNTARKAAWRKRLATEAQVKWARSLGCKLQTETSASGIVTVTERAGSVSDKIDTVLATQRLDPLVKALRILS